MKTPKCLVVLVSVLFFFQPLTAQEDIAKKRTARFESLDSATKDLILSIARKIKANESNLTAEEGIVLRIYWDILPRELVEKYAIPSADQNFGNAVVKLIDLKDEKSIKDFKFKFGILAGKEKFALALTLQQIKREGQKNLFESQRDLMMPFQPFLAEYLKRYP